MLSRRMFFKAAKQAQSFGELPPLFSDLFSASLTGPAGPDEHKGSTPAPSREEPIEVTLRVERDVTGALRIIID